MGTIMYRPDYHDPMYLLAWTCFRREVDEAVLTAPDLYKRHFYKTFLVKYAYKAESFVYVSKPIGIVLTF